MSLWCRPRGFDLRRIAWRCKVLGHTLEVWHRPSRAGDYIGALRYVAKMNGRYVGDAATEDGAKCAAVMVLLWHLESVEAAKRGEF